MHASLYNELAGLTAGILLQEIKIFVLQGSLHPIKCESSKKNKTVGLSLLYRSAEKSCDEQQHQWISLYFKAFQLESLGCHKLQTWVFLVHYFHHYSVFWDDKKHLNTKSFDFKLPKTQQTFHLDLYFWSLQFTYRQLKGRPTVPLYSRSDVKCYFAQAGIKTFSPCLTKVLQIVLFFYPWRPWKSHTSV